VKPVPISLSKSNGLGQWAWSSVTSLLFVYVVLDSFLYFSN